MLRTMPKEGQILSDASDHAEGQSTDTAVSGRCADASDHAERMADPYLTLRTMPKGSGRALRRQGDCEAV